MTFSMKDRGRLWLIVGLALFAAAKVYWIVLPASIMGMPRLGDDALVYLWTGSNNALAGHAEAPALRDIAALSVLDDQPSAEAQFKRNRVSMRALGSDMSPWHIMTGGLLAIGLDPGLVFAVLELLVSLVLAAGIGILLARLFGTAAGGFGLIFLAFALLPSQGLHYMVPGVLSLAFGLLLLRLALAERPSGGAVGLVALLALLVHPIGFAYVVIAAAFRFTLGLTDGWHRALRLPFFAGVAAAILAWRLIPLLPGVTQEVATGLGGLDLSSVLLNLRRVWEECVYSASRQPWLVGIGAVGTLVLASAWRHHVRALLLIGLFIAAAGAAAAYDLPNYPGEVAIRFVIVPMIVLSGAAGAGLAAAIQWHRPVGLAVASVVLAGVLVLGAPMLRDQVMANVNVRTQVFAADRLRTALASLPQDASILYAETDTGLMMALLAGAERYGAVPLPMISGSPDAQRILLERRPGFLAAIPPQTLNVLAAAGSKSWASRRYQVPLGRVKAVRVEAQQPIERLFLRLDSEEAGSAMPAVQAFGAEEEPVPCDVSGTPWTGAEAGWVEVDFSGCGHAVTEVTIGTGHGAANLTGMSLAPPLNGRAWPWGDPVSLRVVAKNDGEPIVIPFDWTSVLQANDAGALLPLLDAPPEAISDSGGLILARLRWRQP